MDLRERKIINNGAAAEKLPEYAEGKLLHGASQQSMDGMVTNGVNFLGQAVNSFGPVKSSGDILTESGTSVGQGSGFTYQKQNSVDAGAQMSELGKENTANTLQTAAAGASLGSAFGPIGAGIGGVVGGAVGFVGGLFRKNKMADRIREAQLQAVRNNNFSLASAQTDYLTNQYNLEHNNTQDDRIYAAEGGKQPNVVDNAMQQSGFVKKNGKWIFDGHAMMSNGEAWGHKDPITGQVLDLHKVGRGRDNNDSVKIKMGDTPEEVQSTFVVTNKGGASQYTLNTGDVDGGLALGELAKMEGHNLVAKLIQNGGWNKNQQTGILQAKCGKRPKYGYGRKDVLSDWQTALDSAINEANEPYELKNTFKTPWEIATGNTNPHYTTEDRAAVTAATREPEKNQDNTYKGNYSYGVENALATLFGLATAYGQRPKGVLSSPNTNTHNQYESQALNALASLSTNEAAEKEAAYNTEARNRYNINRAGGLSGAQKYLSAVQSGIGLQRNIAGIIADNNAKRNGYITNWATTAAQLGGQGAARAQQALTHDYDAYARAHGAAIQQANMSSLNALSQIQQYLKNMQKIGMFNRTMAYYDQDYQLRKDALNRGWYNIG